jgi:hypothetical protein
MVVLAQYVSKHQHCNHIAACIALAAAIMKAAMYEAALHLL